VTYQRHVQMLRRNGVRAWNKWRNENRDIQPDLFRANLVAANLSKANLVAANLREADLRGAALWEADLRGADLREANLKGANLVGANLDGANLGGATFVGATLSHATLIHATLSGATLSHAHLFEANLTGADLSGAICIETNFFGATLAGCIVYGVSAWDVDLEGAAQADLRITPVWETSHIAVDNLEVAQFLYLLLHSEKMRDVLDTITSKLVLILGRFSDERKPILDALREALRRHPNGYIPVLFDFEPQTRKPVLETVKILANLSRFIIADMTDPHVIYAELTAITSHVPSVPIQPILQKDAELPTVYDSWALSDSFLAVYRYADRTHLLANLTVSVIAPIEARVQARKL
jgi:pentapeptide repeat protein